MEWLLYLPGVEGLAVHSTSPLPGGTEKAPQCGCLQRELDAVDCIAQDGEVEWDVVCVRGDSCEGVMRGEEGR